MQNSEDSSNDSSEQERIKRVKLEKKKSKRKLVESREDLCRNDSISEANQTLNTFLAARKHLKTVKNASNTQQLTIHADEEVWIFQCPKNIDTVDLLGRKLILPQPVQIIQSKRGNKEFECKLEVTKQENHLTVILPTNEFPEAVSVKQAGMISIRERIKLPQPKENGNVDLDDTDRRFFYPTNLKIRHPLLGVNFENIEIKEEADDESSIRISPKKRKSNGHHSSDKIKIKQEPEEDMIISPLKKEKKRSKRPRESIEIKVEPDDEAQPAKKHKQNNKKGRLSEDNSTSEYSTLTKHKRPSIKIERD